MENYEEVPYDPPDVITPEELESYCAYLGLDPKEDPDLLWIAEEGIKAPLPPGWIFFQHKTEDKSFFYNQTTGVSTDEHPADAEYLKLFQEEKRKKMEKQVQSIEDSTFKTESSGMQFSQDTNSSIPRVPQRKINDEEERELIAEHENRMRQLKNNQEKELNAKKREYKEALDAMDAKIQEVQSNCEIEVAKVRKDYDKQLAQIQANYDAEKSRMVATHKKEMAQLQIDNQKEIDDFVDQHKKTVENLRRIHEEKLKKIKAKAANHLDSVSKEYSTPSKSDELLQRLDDSNQMELASKKKEFQRELAKQDAQQQQRLAELKSQFASNLASQQRENNAKIEAVKQECEDELKRYKKQLEIDKKKLLASAKKEAREKALSNSLASFSIDTTRIASIKPRPKSLKAILRRSAPFSLNLSDDEYYGDLEMTRVVTILDIEGDDSDSLTEVPPFNDNRPNIRPKILSDSSFSSDDSDLFARTDTKAAKIQNAAAKANAQFGATADKAASGIATSFKDLENKSNNLRSYCAEQNRDLTKMALDFQQRTLEISKMFHSTLMELDSAHRTAISAVSSTHEMIPAPPHIVYTTPPPRRPRRVVYEVEDTSDDRDTTTMKYLRMYERENHEAKNSNRRLKRKFAAVRAEDSSFD